MSEPAPPAERSPSLPASAGPSFEDPAPELPLIESWASRLRRHVLGLATILALAVAVLAYSAHEAAQLYDLDIPQGDGAYLYAYSGSILQYAQREGVAKGVDMVLAQSGDFYILNNLVAVLLSPWIPFSHLFALYVNGVWLLAMSVCAYWLFWRRTDSAVLAVLLSIPLVIAGPPLASYPGGLADLNVNLLGYTLGTSALCCMLLSQGFRRMLPCLFAGLFLGLLALGRIFALAPVLAAAFPLVVLALVRGTWSERCRTIGGGALLAVTALAVGGWFVFPRLSLFLGYFTRDFGPGATLGVARWSELFTTWTKFILSVYCPHRGYIALVLVWCGAFLYYRTHRVELGLRWKDLNWVCAWMGLAPIAMQVYLKSVYTHYAWPAILGLYLLLVFPFQRQGRESCEVLKLPRFRFFLIAASLSALAGFGLRFSDAYAGSNLSRAAIRRIADVILDDNRPTGRREITLGLTHHIITELGSLSSVFMFDRQCVVYGMFENGLEGSAEHPRIVMRPDTVTGPAAWDEELYKERVFTVDAMFARMNEKVDYCVILAPEAWTAHWDAYWMKYYPKWVELSRRLLESPRWTRLSDPLNVHYLETVIVLKKKPAGG